MSKEFINRVLLTDSSFTSLALRLSAGNDFRGARRAETVRQLWRLRLGRHRAVDGLYRPGAWLLNGACRRQCRVLWGIALLIGLLTRPAALMLALTMLVAILTVHLPNGLFMDNGGYEFGLALLGISVALVFNGGGKLSLDRKLIGATS